MSMFDELDTAWADALAPAWQPDVLALGEKTAATLAAELGIGERSANSRLLKAYRAGKLERRGVCLDGPQWTTWAYKPKGK
jgi:hypothetical protein